MRRWISRVSRPFAGYRRRQHERRHVLWLESHVFRHVETVLKPPPVAVRPLEQLYRGRPLATRVDISHRLLRAAARGRSRRGPHRAARQRRGQAADRRAQARHTSHQPEKPRDGCTPRTRRRCCPATRNRAACSLDPLVVARSEHEGVERAEGWRGASPEWYPRMSRVTL